MWNGCHTHDLHKLLLLLLWARKCTDVLDQGTRNSGFGIETMLHYCAVFACAVNKIIRLTTPTRTPAKVKHLRGLTLVCVFAGRRGAGDLCD